MNIEKIAIESLIPYVNNQKQHPEAQIEKIAGSIKEFGFLNPIIVDKDNVIIAGHGRYEAAKRLGLEKVPVIRAEHLTQAQIKAYRIADNRLAELAIWDEELLAVELAELEEINFDMDLLGFNEDELNGLLDIKDEEVDYEKADEVPEVEEEEIIIKRGDLIELGKNFQHRILCGDSTKEEDVERLMNGEKADMVFTDPPYGMNLDTDYSSLNWRDRKGKKYEKVIGDNEDFRPELITTIFNNFGYCKEIFLWGADYFYKYIPEFDKGHYLVWDKTLESNGNADSNSEFELLWTKNKHKRQVIHFNWFRYFGLSSQDIKQRVHPTQKPLQVCEPIIEKYSKENKIIIDLFLGSGSTLIACENLKRICYGMELDEKYCQVVIERYVTYTGNPKIKINGKEVDWYEYKKSKQKA
jgi:DNA modification methylase